MTIKRKQLRKNIFTILGGIFVGFINGFLGAGGGMIVVPLLTLLNKEEQKISHATAVMLILPISLVSAITYLINKQIDFQILLQTGVGTIIGGVIGTFALCKFKSEFIGYLFALIMVISGVMMIIKA